MNRLGESKKAIGPAGFCFVRGALIKPAARRPHPKGEWVLLEFLNTVPIRMTIVGGKVMYIGRVKADLNRN
jgi:hypothetical protein